MTTARERHLLKSIELANVALEAQLEVIEGQRAVIKYYEDRIREMRDAVPTMQEVEARGCPG